ncbi:hypothetical protein MMC22_004807 [Lobaria immixta]|nr:hypothetical protein [Lobaria immixta]
MPSDPADRVASHAQVHALCGFIKPRWLEAPLDRTYRSLSRGPKIGEIGPRVRPRDLDVREKDLKHISAGTQIVQGVTVAVAASPLIVDVVEATTSVERQLICLFEAVPFAEGRAELGNCSHLGEYFVGGVPVSATPADFGMYGVLVGVGVIFWTVLPAPPTFSLETILNLLVAYRIFPEFTLAKEGAP